MTDEELVDLVCKGETRRFEELVQRHQDAVFVMARRYAAESGDAEDIAQEVFLKAFRSLESFRREAQFATWLYRITYNVCVDWQRRYRRASASFRLFDGDAEIADHRSNVESEALADIERREVRRAADGLPERYRTVIMMYYFDERSYEEIGEIMGMPARTVETRLYRARRLMRKALKRRIGGDSDAM